MSTHSSAPLSCVISLLLRTLAPACQRCRCTLLLLLLFVFCVCFVLFCFVFLSPRRRGVPKPRFATNVILHLFPSQLNNGDVAWSVERRTGTSLTQVRFPCAARDFSPRVSFQCRLSSGVRTSPCAIACIYICAHVRDPVVHARVRWIIKILKHPEYTLGWVTRLCRSLLSPGKATRFSHGSNPKQDNTVVKKYFCVPLSLSLSPSSFSLDLYLSISLSTPFSASLCSPLSPPPLLPLLSFRQVHFCCWHDLKSCRLTFDRSQNLGVLYCARERAAKICICRSLKNVLTTQSQPRFRWSPVSQGKNKNLLMALQVIVVGVSCVQRQQ